MQNTLAHDLMWKVFPEYIRLKIIRGAKKKAIFMCFFFKKKSAIQHGETARIKTVQSSKQ